MDEVEDFPSDILDSISRCAAVMGDDACLQDELHVLRLSSDPLAHFATSLIELERARRGVPGAREELGELAESLLLFWRDASGPKLAVAHPFLEDLWERAASLLAAFDAQRFNQALAACWGSRTDAGHLTVAIEELLPEGSRRVEFARCLYHLELARLMVDSSRAEFARRAGLLAEAYQDADVAKELIGDDPGLEHLWSEVVPYLDEFFEQLEEDAAKRARAAAAPRTLAPSEASDLHLRPTSPGFQLEAELASQLAATTPSAPSPVAAGTRLHEEAGVAFLVDPLDFGDAIALSQGIAAETASVEQAPGTEVAAIEEAPEAEAAAIEEAPEAEAAAIEEVPEAEAAAIVEAPEAEAAAVEEVPEAEAAAVEEVPEAEAAAVEEVPEVEAAAVEEVPEGDELTDSAAFDLIEEVSDDEVIAVSHLPPVPPPLPTTPAAGVAPAARQPSLGERGDPAPPDKATSEFWLHTFQSLQLLPGELGRGSRMMACETRADRKRLSQFIDSLAPYLAVPEARAMACLVSLTLAGQTKEKSLFGQPNPRRAEALAGALPYLHSPPEAAAHVAVWFELDGPETQAALAQGLSLLVEYLAYCHRSGRDPLATPTMEAFTEQG